MMTTVEAKLANTRRRCGRQFPMHLQTGSWLNSHKTV